MKYNISKRFDKGVTICDPFVNWHRWRVIFDGAGDISWLSIALAAFFSVCLNTAVGVRQIPGKLIQASRAPFQGDVDKLIWP